MLRSLWFGWLVIALACASSQANTSATQTAGTANAPAPPPLPSDPFELIPADATLFASARIEFMKSRDAFASLRRVVLRYGCVDESDLNWLVAQTSRALLAGRGERERAELLVLLAGQFNPADARRAAALLARHSRAPESATAQMHGAFTIERQGPWSATVLDGRLLVAGHAGFVDSTLAALERPPSVRYAQTPIFQELGGHVQCSERSACALVAAHSPVAQLLKRELSSVGMKKVGRVLASGHSALTLAVGDGIHLNVVAQLGNEADAEDLAQATRDWLWQAGLVTRLAGFPDVLGDAEIETQAAYTELKLKLGQSDLARVEQRLDQMLGDDAAARCAADIASLDPKAAAELVCRTAADPPSTASEPPPSMSVPAGSL